MVTTSAKTGSVPAVESKSIRNALRTVDGSMMPSMEIKKDGRSLSYDDLKTMTVEDLAGCSITLWDSALTFGPDSRGSMRFSGQHDGPVEYSANYCGFGDITIGANGYGFKADESAIATLEIVNEIVRGCCSGGI